MSAPSYAATVNTGPAILGGFDASFTAPATAKVSVLVTSGSLGSKVEEVQVKGLATLAAGIVNVFIRKDVSGTYTYYLKDQFVLTITPAASTTIASYDQTHYFPNLVLPPTTGAANTWSLCATHTTTGNDTTKLCVIAAAGDLTA